MLIDTPAIENVHFNKRLADIQQSPEGVTLTFADGDVVQTSMVAGSDGIKSTVREHVLQDHPREVALKYEDLICHQIGGETCYPIGLGR